MRKYLTDVISIDGIDVVSTAIDGKDALSKISAKTPDVILLDLEMPRMDGLTFIENMVKTGTLIPTIIVSSFSQNGSKLVLDALENGAVDFVTIPQDMVEKEKLRDALITKNRNCTQIRSNSINSRKIKFIKTKNKTNSQN